MKEINELDLPEDLHYTEDHEWAKVTGENVTIGISDYAQDQLGDIVFVEMPAPGDRFKKGTNSVPLSRSRLFQNSICPLTERS
jgi:glycine cleavage system H protein